MPLTVSKSNSGKAAVKIVVAWGIQTIAIVLIANFYEKIHVEDVATAFLLAGVIGLLNALIWPALSAFTLKITIYTFGFAALFFNALIIMVSAEVVNGVYIEDLWAAMWVAVGITILNVIISGLFSLDDDSSYYQNVMRKRLEKQGSVGNAKDDGIIFLEIDGLSKQTLEKALDMGYMPTVKSWLATETHTLDGWETDLSSQTGASQAGLLLGSNVNIPAFRWVLKNDNNRIVTSSGPNDTPAIEAEHSTGKGLLAQNGGSRTNLFSGDAEDVVFTYSKLQDFSKLYNKVLYGFFSNPYNLIRTFALTFWDIVLEVKSQVRQSVRDVQPRLGKHRFGAYPLIRAFTTVFLRDLTTYVLIADIYTGQKDVIYSTYAAYDEIAHHSGVEDPDAFYILSKIDNAFKRLTFANNEAQRKYKFVVLSDHGQSKGATFKQRYKITLDELVKQLIGEQVRVKSNLSTEEGWGNLNMVLTGVAQDKDSLTGRTVRSIVRKKMYQDSVVLGPEAKQLETDFEADRNTERVLDDSDNAIVLASGNLGLIYLTKWKNRATLEQLNAQYPNLILGLAQHDGVGFIMVDSKEFGPLAISANGVYHLKTGKIEGVNPLQNFGPNAAQHLLREHSYNNVPDILVNSFYDRELDEGCAYEELIGFHGGLGGNQAHAFVMHPVEFSYPSDPVIGAENVHKILLNWTKRATSTN